jgi:hypothetical protein
MWTAAILATVLAWAAPLVARDKIDVVVMANGDRITCEIRELERGILKVKPSYTSSTVSLEWINVAELQSPQLFEIEEEDGTRHFGMISAAAEQRRMVVVGGVTTSSLDLQSVVRIAPLGEEIWDRFKGSLNLGLNAAKAKKETILNVRGSVSYRTRKRLISADLTSDITTRAEEEAKRYIVLSARLARFLGKKWFWFMRPAFERNDELGLEQRLSLAGGGGLYLVQSYRSLLSFTFGLSGNEERYVEVPPDPDPLQSNPTTTTQNNLEGLVGLQWEVFTFGSRETDLSLALGLLPNFTTGDRLRFEFRGQLRHELVNDFFVSLDLDVNYDTRPPSDQEKSDWNLVTSVGYTF